MRTVYVVLISISILLFFLAHASCSSSSSLAIEHSTLSVDEFTADPTHSISVVNGIVRNNGIWPVQNYSVVADFYDKNSIKIASNSYLLPKLEPGEICPFKIQLKGTQAWQVSRYELSVAAHQ